MFTWILIGTIMMVLLGVSVLAVLSFRFSSRIIAATGRVMSQQWLITTIDVLSSIVLGVGILFLTSPLVLYWWIHGNYERYLWIIKGPLPYSQFGGGPFQLWIGVSLLLLGLIFISVGIVLRQWFWQRLRKLLEDRI